jgi:hypothetical protein
VQTPLGDRALGAPAGAGLAGLAARPVGGPPAPTPQTVKALADRIRGDADFVGVASLWAGDALGRPDAVPAEVVGELVDAEHVPFLAAYGYKFLRAGPARGVGADLGAAAGGGRDRAPLGHGGEGGAVTHPEVRRGIEQEIGEIPVPPKYGSVLEES